ncbi:MAG: hypothetical protein WCJ17_02145 [bacterium]
MLGAGAGRSGGLDRPQMLQFQAIETDVRMGKVPQGLVEQVRRGSYTYTPTELLELLSSACHMGVDTEEMRDLIVALVLRRCLNVDAVVRNVMTYLYHGLIKTQSAQERLFALCDPQSLIKYLTDNKSLIIQPAFMMSLPSALQSKGVVLSAEQMNSFFGYGSMDVMYLINKDSLSFIQNLLNVVHEQDREKVSERILARVRELSSGPSDDASGSDSDGSGSSDDDSDSSEDSAEGTDSGVVMRRVIKLGA